MAAELRHYKPGQSIHSVAVYELDAVFVDPSTIIVTLHLPDASSSIITQVRDSIGNYHADAVVPFSMIPGIGAFRWRTTGASPSDNSLKERRFIIDPLDF